MRLFVWQPPDPIVADIKIDCNKITRANLTNGQGAAAGQPGPGRAVCALCHVCHTLSRSVTPSHSRHRTYQGPETKKEGNFSFEMNEANDTRETQDTLGRWFYPSQKFRRFLKDIPDSRIGFFLGMKLGGDVKFYSPGQ